MAAQDFLFEIGTEELPPKSLQKLSAAFTANVIAELTKAKLEYLSIESFATPRRLAVLITKLSVTQPSQTIEKRGPALKAAYDADGNPTKATLGFVKSCNTTVAKLSKLETDKGSWLLFKQKKPGVKTVDLLPGIITASLNNLPIPKLMRWGNGEEAFIRPVHWIAMLYGSKVVKAEFFSVQSSNKTYGHRFHAPQAITVRKPAEYEALLKTNKVIADFEERKNQIKSQINTASKQYGVPVMTEELLTEVTGLVEWPVALAGEFPQRFLKLPYEVLILVLQQQQKYFPICSKDGKLTSYFITISNIKSKKPNQVIAGNERVINARLTDAEFFYNSDIKIPLQNHLPKLKEVVFQKQLGTIYDKTIRVKKLAVFLAKQLNLAADKISRAAELSKTDLVTKMVFEFSELQGVMGYYYALAQKEQKEIALALKEQYMPRFADDGIPSSDIGAVLAISDKIDTIVGIFGINQQPTGTKDPFALRRAALGILKIIIEKKLPLDLDVLLQHAIENYKQLPNKNTKIQVLEFILERLKTYYLERSVSPQIFVAVLANKPTEPLDFNARINAVTEFVKLPAAESLAAANKRVSNILRKENYQAKGKIEQKLLQEPAEQKLAQELVTQEKNIEPLFKAKNYTAVLKSLAQLKPHIDKFFDEVMVMADDKALCNNRLALLAKLRSLFLQVADISLLQ